MSAPAIEAALRAVVPWRRRCARTPARDQIDLSGEAVVARLRMASDLWWGRGPFFGSPGGGGGGAEAIFRRYLTAYTPKKLLRGRCA